MTEVGDKSTALVVTSPPYPMIAMWDDLEFFKGKSWEQQHNFLNKVWKECYRVLIDGGIIAINIGDATRKVDGIFQLYPNHSKIISYCMSIGFVCLPFILWKKSTNKPNSFLGSGMLPTNAYVTQDCEFILLLRRGDIRKFIPKDTIRYKSKYTFEERNKWFSQIWTIQGAKQSIAKAIFPLEIPLRLIRMFSIEGDRVLDPFIGSGTTAVACKATKRNYIGYETSKEYIKIADVRLKDGK